MKTKRGNIDSIVAKVLNRKSKALPIAGAVVQNQAKALCVVGKYPAGSGMVGGNLRNSIYLIVKNNVAYIGSNLVYSAMVEFGGPIVPVTARALTIPQDPRAYGKRAADFPGIFKPKGKDYLAIEENGKLIVLFLLRKKVVIPKQPYLRPALEMKRDEVLKILQAA